MDITRRLGQDAERLAKAPAWTRSLVEDLAREARRHRDRVRELTHVPDGNTTVADPYADHPLPIGRNPHVRHTLEDGSQFTIECDTTELKIIGTSAHTSTMVLMPWVSNVVRVAWRADQ
jgi:hypothetical protein